MPQGDGRNEVPQILQAEVIEICLFQFIKKLQLSSDRETLKKTKLYNVTFPISS